MRLPRVLAIAGKKKSGKDFLADSFVTHQGFHKIHIADVWLQKWCADNGINYHTEYLPNKSRYRAAVQTDATIARSLDPNVLLHNLAPRVEALLGEHKGVAISGLRFHNESLYCIQRGWFVAKVWVTDAERRRRFELSGEDLALLYDPFESQIRDLPCHMEIEGVYTSQEMIQMVSAGYEALLSLATSELRAP